MPALQFALLIAAVMLAAGLTIVLLQGLIGPMGTIAGGALIAGLMILRLMLQRQ